MLRWSQALVAILAVLAVPALAIAQEDAAGGPKMVVPEKIVDVGDVPQGEVVDANFKIINEGDDTLVINAVRPTCGCTVADFDREIKAGGAGYVKAKLDTRDFTGPVAKAILVLTSDPQTSAVNLTIKANVRPYVEVLPRPLVTFNSLQGEGAEQKIVIAPVEDNSGFKVTSVDGGADMMAVAIRQLGDDELVRGKAKPQYELTITVKDEAPLGSVNQELVVHTNHPKAEKVPVKVYGVVRTVLQVSPTQIQFGSVEAASGAGQYVMVANNRQGSELQITSAKIDDPAFSAEVRPVQEGQRYQVVVTIKRDAEPGPRDARLVLTTSDEAHRELVVPVRANIL